MKNTPYLFWIISGKNAFQAFFMVFIITATLPLLFTAPPPTSIEATLPTWCIYTWVITLFVGATMNLTGIYWRGEAHKGIRIEKLSCAFLGVSTLVYPLTILDFNFIAHTDRVAPPGLSFTVTLLFGLSIASWGRLLQLRRADRELDQFKAAVRNMKRIVAE